MSSFNRRGCYRCGGPLDDVLANGVEIILEMDFVRFAMQEPKIHSFMIQIRILSIILPIFLTNLHNPSTRHTRELSHNQNSGDNYYPQNSLRFPQQYLCCEKCGGPHESFQCQPRNQNYFEPNPCYNPNSYSFNQPTQIFIDHQPLQEMSIQEMEDLKQHYLDEMLSLSNDLGINDYRNEKIDIRFRRECEDMIDELKDISQEPSSNTITPVLPTLEPEDSLIMENGELNTIPEKESNEFIKSSVEDLVPIPKESEDTSGSDSECILPSCDDVELLLHHDPSIPKMSVVSILEGFTDEPPLEENDDLLDLGSKDIELKKILYNDPIDDLIFDPGGGIDEIDAFLDIKISTDVKDGFYNFEGDILFLENLLSDDITPNPPPEVFLDHDPRSLRVHSFFHQSSFSIESSIFLHSIDLFIARLPALFTNAFQPAPTKPGVDLEIFTRSKAPSSFKLCVRTSKSLFYIHLEHLKRSHGQTSLSFSMLDQQHQIYL
nr:hypothetical protein [Tanacetum cinerariifolium]